MKRTIKRLAMSVVFSCILLSGFSCVMAAENNVILAEECCGKIYNPEGEILSQSIHEVRTSCTHIPCNRVTDTVWQHRHTGLRCDVYTANATWCKCCNTILNFNSGWVYSYTHYGCNL